MAEENQADLNAQLSAAADAPAEAQTAPAIPATEPQPANQPEVQQAAPPPPAWREVASELNFTIPEDMDEKAVFRQLMEGFSQGSQAQRQLQEITPHWSEFQKFRQQQEEQARAAKAKEQEQPWWHQFHKPVDYDPKWEQLIGQDADGNLIPKPGAPLDIVQRYKAAQDARANLAAKMTDPTNPFGWLEGPVTHLAEQKAEAIYKKLREQEKAAEYAKQVVTSEEMRWLYQFDKNNQPVTDQYGRPALSPLGNTYQQAVSQLQQYNLPLPLQHQFALSQARAEYAMSQLQQTPPAQAAPQAPQQTPRERANEKMYAQHERQPNMAGLLPGPADRVSAPLQETAMSTITDMLAADLKDYTDKDVRDFALGAHRRG